MSNINIIKMSQVLPGVESPASPYVTQSTEDIGPTELSKEESARQDMLKKELEFKSKQLQFIQEEISALQQQVTAQLNPTNQPAGDNMEELDRLEDQEQDDLAQQQSVNMQNQMMQQTQQNQTNMSKLQQDIKQQVQASRWVMPEHANVRIAVKNLELECDVAATPRQQSSGLQAYRSLSSDKGLWFPFNVRRTASFHMGDVKFPIDIVFIDTNKIAKIVANVRPRQMGSWSAICTDVIEVNGGWCQKHGISVGDEVQTPSSSQKTALSDPEKLLNTSYSAPQDARISSDKEDANSYDTLRTITTAEGEEEGFSPEEEAAILQTFPFLKAAQSQSENTNWTLMVFTSDKKYSTIVDENFEGPLEKAFQHADSVFSDAYDISDLESLDPGQFGIPNFGTYEQHMEQLESESLPSTLTGTIYKDWKRNPNYEEAYAKFYLFPPDSEYGKMSDTNIILAYLFAPEEWEPEEEFDLDDEDAEVLEFPKKAQEHRQPDQTDRRDPGEIDNRNPTDRFEHNTLPDEFSPFGDGDGADIDPFSGTTNAPDGGVVDSGNYGKDFKLQLGYDPVEFREEDHPYALRPSAQIVTVDSPSADTELAGLDKEKLASGAVKLFDMYGPDWEDYISEDGGRNYEKMAVVNDQKISNWIDGLGFNEQSEAKLRQSMFTDEFKKLMGNALVSSSKISDWEIFDSDLLLYQ